MSTIPASPTNESAYQLFDRWLEHWQRRTAHRPGHSPERSQQRRPRPQPRRPAPHHCRLRRPPLRRSPAVTRPRTTGSRSSRRSPSTEGGPGRAPAPPRRTAVDNERQAGGAILRFPGRDPPHAAPVPDRARWAIPPTGRAGRGAARRARAAPPPGRGSSCSRRAPGMRPVLTAGHAVAGAGTALSVAGRLRAPPRTPPSASRPCWPSSPDCSGRHGCEPPARP